MPASASLTTGVIANGAENAWVGRKELRLLQKPVFGQILEVKALKRRG
jgi:hypothetical protein